MGTVFTKEHNHKDTVFRYRDREHIVLGVYIQQIVWLGI